MTDIDKMRRYIERTGEKFPSTYHLSMGELEAQALAFEYGRAKGFRYSRKGEEA